MFAKLIISHWLTLTLSSLLTKLLTLNSVGLGDGFITCAIFSKVFTLYQSKNQPKKREAIEEKDEIANEKELMKVLEN